MEHAIALNLSLGPPFFKQTDEAWPSAKQGDATHEMVVAAVGASLS